MSAGGIRLPPRVEAEHAVKLVLANTGQVFHGLSSPGFVVNLEAGAGETASLPLTIAENCRYESRRYEFLCTVPGHATGGCAANSW